MTWRLEDRRVCCTDRSHLTCGAGRRRCKDVDRAQTPSEGVPRQSRSRPAASDPDYTLNCDEPVYRNPTAHDPRLSRAVSDEELLEVLDVVSVVHRRPDGARRTSD